VVADVAALREVVEAARVGAVFRRDSREALVHALVGMLKRAAQEGAAWAEQSRAHVEAHHTVRHITEQTLAVYEGLMKS